MPYMPSTREGTGLCLRLGNIIMLPEELLIAAFWRCIRDDLAGRGCTSDGLRGGSRRLPYNARVIIEREQLRAEAQLFMNTPDFDWWAEMAGLDSEHLRTQLYVNSK